MKLERLRLPARRITSLTGPMRLLADEIWDATFHSLRAARAPEQAVRLHVARIRGVRW